MELRAKAVAVATLSAIARTGEMPPTVPQDAMRDLGIDPERRLQPPLAAASAFTPERFGGSALRARVAPRGRAPYAQHPRGRRTYCARGLEAFCQVVIGPDPGSGGAEGQRRSPYEQKTQQSRGRGLTTAPQPLHS